MNKDIFNKLHEKFSELVDAAEGRKSELLTEYGIGEVVPTNPESVNQDVLEGNEGEDTNLPLTTPVKEQMSDEQAKNIVANMKKGLVKCATKHKGNPTMIKTCQDRLNRVIAGIKSKYGV